MTDKELIEVSNRAWDAFVDQMPKVITGRDLLKIVFCFVVNAANALDMRPIAVCMMMYDRLNDERHSIKIIKIIEIVLLFAGIVTLMGGTAYMLWINYQIGAKLFDIGFICLLACWVLELAVKVIDRWI